MHNCDEFRERITEHIIDREDLSVREEFQRELLICSSCSEFYAESREMIDALSSVDLSISESQWQGIEDRMRSRVILEKPAAPVMPSVVSSLVSSINDRRRPRPYRTAPWRQLLVAAALLVITVGLSRLTVPVVTVQPPEDPAPQTEYIDHSVLLDPVTVDFLEESELLLRNVMKIAPDDVEDLAEARKTAGEQLVGIKLRKEAAAEVPPVVAVMDTYETILRDLRNLDVSTVAEDIPDIQKRIQKTALIANMKAFQPNLNQVSFGLQ